MWDVNEPRLDERRANAPEAPRHRARKDRRRWCRGKVGVEHTPEVRLSRHSLYLAARFPDRVQCGWDHWWKRDADDRVVPDHDSWHWRCGHERGCSTCGKVLDPFLGKGCPGYHDRTE